MPENDVRVTMRSSTGDAQQAWLQFIGVLGQVEAHLKRIGRTGNRAGRQTQTGMAGATRGMVTFGQSVMRLVGVGSPLAVMLTTVTLIRRELEQYKSLTKEATSFQLERAAAFEEATRLLPGRVTKAGDPFTREDLERMVSQGSARTGLSQITVLKNLPSLLSATGAAPPELLGTEEVVETQFRLAELKPGFIAPGREQELKQTGAAVLEIIKSQALKGKSVTVDQATAALFKAFGISRAENLAEFGGPAVAVISEITAKRPQEIFEHLMAVQSAVGQAAVDRTGRRIATNYSRSLEDMLRIVDEEAPELRDLESETLRDMIKNADESQPKLNRIRRRIQSVFAPDLSAEDIRNLAPEFKKGEIQGEQRTRGLFRAMYIPGSAIDLAIERNIIAMGDAFGEAAVEDLIRESQAVQDMSVMFPLRQERTRVASEEASFVSEQSEVRRMNILNTTAEVLKHTRSGVAGSATVVDIAAELNRIFGTKDPLITARSAIQRIDHAIAAKRAESSDEDTILQVQIRADRIKALQITRELVKQELAALTRERADRIHRAGGLEESKRELDVAARQHIEETIIKTVPPGERDAVQRDIDRAIRRDIKDPNAPYVDAETHARSMQGALREHLATLDEKIAQAEDSLERFVTGRSITMPSVVRMLDATKAFGVSSYMGAKLGKYLGTPDRAKETQQLEQSVTDLKQRRDDLRKELNLPVRDKKALRTGLFERQPAALDDRVSAQEVKPFLRELSEQAGLSPATSGKFIGKLHVPTGDVEPGKPELRDPVYLKPRLLLSKAVEEITDTIEALEKDPEAARSASRRKANEEEIERLREVQRRIVGVLKGKPSKLPTEDVLKPARDPELEKAARGVTAPEIAADTQSLASIKAMEARETVAALAAMNNQQGLADLVEPEFTTPRGIFGEALREAKVIQARDGGGANVDLTALIATLEELINEIRRSRGSPAPPPSRPGRAPVEPDPAGAAALP